MPRQPKIKGGANHIVFKTHDGTAFTDELTLNNVISSPAARQADGTYQIDITQTEDTQALEDFLKGFRVTGAAATTTTTTYEDSTEDVEVNGGADIPYVYCYRYSGKSTETTPKRSVFVGKGFIDPTSGSHDSSAGAYSNPKIVWKSVPETEDRTIAETDFESTLVTGAAKELPAGSTGEKFFLPAA